VQRANWGNAEQQDRDRQIREPCMHAATDTSAVIAHLLAPSEAIPNHPRWPLLIFPGAVAIEGSDPARAFESLFSRNGWPPAWRNGVYPFPHFHSNAHEALGFYSGEATVLFGGDEGVVVTARPGDVIVLPAGTGHRRLSSRGSLGVVGAYPQGQGEPDLCRPPSSDPALVAAIVAVPLPAADPVYGEKGPLFAHWLR
jgi:uncharacterized protein YjlB